MLRKVRITLAALFLVGITLLLAGIGWQWWGWMAKLQFLPSFLALNLSLVVGILLLTFVFGRIYCSVICPLGVFQDVVIRLRHICWKLSPKKSGKLRKRFQFSPERKWVRFVILGLVIGGAVVSSQLFLSLLAPYSAYGRIVRGIVGLASGESVAPALLITAGATLALVFVFAWVGGRDYCNMICPVGSVLSLVSRFSLFRPVIDTDKCVSCGACESRCKASCIDGKGHLIDGSRCVDCFDCIGNCKKGAIQYKFVGLKPQAYRPAPAPAKDKGKAVDGGRRKFLATSAVLVGGGIAAGAQNKRLDGGLADVQPKRNPQRTERLVPFGAMSVRRFYDHCTGCQLCVSNCPNDVLRPSTDIEHFLQPVMGYEKGYCRPECTTCSQVCPAGAIFPIERDEKLSIRIGTARVNLDLCLAAKGEARCGNCSRHCPVGAVRMVRSEGYDNPVPVVAEAQCIGCGACENLCPSRPLSAITVDGLSTHISKTTSKS